MTIKGRASIRTVRVWGRGIFAKTRNGHRKRSLEAVKETSPDFIIWPLWCGYLKNRSSMVGCEVGTGGILKDPDPVCGLSYVGELGLR